MAEPEVVESPHPALFELRRGGLDSPVVAHGVQWPDGTITVNHVEAAWAHQAYSSLEVFSQEVPGTVVWLRQDTYTDQEV